MRVPDPRRVEGRIGGEPRIGLFGRSLGGSGLTGHFDQHPDENVPGRADGPGDDATQALANRRQRLGFERHLAGDLRLDDLLRALILGTDARHDLRAVHCAAVSQRTVGRGHLERRHEQIPLPDADVHRVAIVPDLAFGLLVSRVRHQPGLLIQLDDAGGTAQPERARHVGQKVHVLAIDLIADFVKGHIAGSR